MIEFVGLFRASQAESLITPPSPLPEEVFIMSQPIPGRRHPEGGWGGDKCAGGMYSIVRVGESSTSLE